MIQFLFYLSLFFLDFAYGGTSSPERGIDWSKIDNILPIEADKEWSTYSRQISQGNDGSKEAKQLDLKAEARRDRSARKAKLLMKSNKTKSEGYKIIADRLKERSKKKTTNQKPQIDSEEKKAEKVIKDRLRNRNRTTSRKARTGFSTLRSQRLDELKKRISFGTASAEEQAELERMREAARKWQRKHRSQVRQHKIIHDMNSRPGSL